jgi:hypothetical protein
MAEIGRIDLGLSEYEFWRLTPRQFYGYMQRHIAAQQRQEQLVRFLATASARAAGHNVNYMEDASEAQPDAGVFAAWLQSRAK